MCFEKNLEQLKICHDCLYEKVVDTTFEWDENRVTIEKARNGEPVVVYIKDGIKQYLNSRYNPSKEAEKYMEDAVNLTQKSTLVIVGFGNGFHVREFIDKVEEADTNCIVFEPSKDIFMRILHDIDISDILSNQRVHIVVHGMNDAIGTFLCSEYIHVVNEKTNIHIVLPKYQQLFPETCEEIVNTLRNRYQDLIVERNTIKKYGEQGAYNYIHNMCFLPGCRSSVEYIGKFPKGLPGIVVSAGPSLEKNVELLKKVKGRAVILVVDSAIRMVMSKGIIPDMVITMDNHKPVQLFEVPGVEKIPFLIDMSANTEVLEKVKPEKLVVYSADSIIIDQLFKETGSDVRQIYVGGSVALDAMANFVEWGLKTIIFIGQDLMFTNNKVHAGEDEIQDMSQFSYKVVKVKDIYGNEGYTTGDYNIYIREIEKLAERLPDVHFVDATEGGAFIKNTEIMTLQDAIDRYCSKEYNLAEILNYPTKLFVDENAELPIRKMYEMQKHLEKMKKTMEKGVDACNRGAYLLENRNYDVIQLKKINELLQYVDNQYEHFDESVMVLKCTSESYYEFEDSFYVQEEDDILEAIRMYKKSAAFYKSIADAIPKVSSMVDGAIERWNRMYGEL